MTAKPWKLVLLLTGIFLAGAVTGGVVAWLFGREIVKKHFVPEQWGPARLEMLVKRLDLTPAQVETLRPIVKRNVDALADLRVESMTGTRQLLERLEREISAQLTPEQKVKFDKINAERRERLRRLMEQRRSEGGKRGERRDRPPHADEAPPPPPRGGDVDD